MQRNNVKSVALVSIQNRVDNFIARRVKQDKHQKNKVKRIVPNAKQDDT
jgi:hypothetical protein